MVFGWFTSKKDDAEETKPNPEEQNLAILCSKVMDPILKLSGKNPLTIYPIGDNSKLWDYALALSTILRLEHKRDAKLDPITGNKPIGFRSLAEGRALVFMDEFYDDGMYGTLKEGLECLDWKTAGAKYMTLFSMTDKTSPDSKMYGFGPISLTNEERRVKRILERYGNVSDEEEAIDPVLEPKHASRVRIGNMVYGKAVELYQAGKFEDIETLFALFNQTFAKPAADINLNRSAPNYDSASRVKLGEYTGMLWDKFSKITDGALPKNGQLRLPLEDV